MTPYGPEVDSPDAWWTFTKAFIWWWRWVWVTIIVCVSISFFVGKEHERRRWSETIMTTYDWSLQAAYDHGFIQGKAECGKRRL